MVRGVVGGGCHADVDIRERNKTIFVLFVVPVDFVLHSILLWDHSKGKERLI